ncbi:SIP domain-containing protein [Sphingomonas sp. MM-1]|uniref:SIP domain-containing protein n=1 Tax=Sphingomonas sp. MM-1 TaxID=745310 RepID=UPI001651AAD8|nr:SIP domain-containing protein [Sphingomonas sp. MM-1]
MKTPKLTYRRPENGEQVNRPQVQADDPAPLLEAISDLVLPDGDGFVWIAAESKVACAARDHFIETRGHPAQLLKAAGYWLRGQADSREKLGIETATDRST